MSNPIKVQCRVSRISPFGIGTYTVDLVANRALPRYKAGQFLHLTVDSYDPAGGFWPESRVFSIASSIAKSTLSFVYSVKGRYTKKMEGYLAPGKEVWVKLPFGDFVVEERARGGTDAVLVAGGTGIAPFIPYLEDVLSRGRASLGLHLYYGIRSLDQMLFRDILDQCFVLPGMDVRLFSETPPDKACAHPVATGRLDPDTILSATRGLQRPVFFLSGPPQMIQKFKAKFIALGVKNDQIQIDEWE